MTVTTRTTIATPTTVTMSIYTDVKAAPKDKPILVYHDPAKAFDDSLAVDTVTPYEFWLDGTGTTKAGWIVAVWGSGYYDGDEPGAGSPADLPNWWFRHDDELEIPVYPTKWALLPED